MRDGKPMRLFPIGARASTHVPLAVVEDIAPETLIEVFVAAPEGVAGFATQPDCPHLSGPLADGLLGGATVVCPLHEWAFDLATGAAAAGGCGIEIYPVRMAEDGTILLTVPLRSDGGLRAGGAQH
jgi:nitrite reductase/ring-hydroxylating ferredoxin subunit